MEARLSFRYDREADILYIDKCPPYQEQESEELGDDVIARLNPDNDQIENLEVLFFSSRLLRGDLFQVPVAATLHRAEQENPRMHQLTGQQLWRRVRQLEGQTVYSLVRSKPNEISKVTDTKVIIVNRKSQITRGAIWDAYKSLWQGDGELTLAKDNPGRFMWAIVPAILKSAIPEQVEAIPGIIGIRLRS